MRTVRVMQYLYLAFLLLCDTVLAVLFNNLGLANINFISSMAFIGLLLFQQTDTPVESAIKVFVVGFWLELNHVATFPVFISTYLLTFLIMGLLKQFIGSEIQEFYILVIVALSLKEVIMYLILVGFKGMIMSPLNFVVVRSFWVILGSLAMIPFVIRMNQRMHRYILQRAQNMYLH